MKIKQVFLLTIISLYSIALSAQGAYKFSSRSDKYTLELREYMTTRTDKQHKKMAEEYILRFEVFWNSDTLTEKQKQQIIVLSNVLSQKRYRPMPEFVKFLDAVWLTARSKKGREIFSQWIKTVGELAGGRSKSNFLRYMDISINLFGHRILYKSQNFYWQASNLNFTYAKEGKYPVFIFDSLDLTCYTRADSGTIYRTRGVYNPLRQAWEGIGGKVYWTRVELDRSKVYAELTKYNIKLKSNRYVCDTVVFYDKRQFDMPLMGRFSEKIMTSKTRRYTYPNFTSFNNNLVIKNVFKDIDYQGGYTLKGASIIGSGTKEQKAYFIFKRKGKRFVWAGAESFNINKDRIRSNHVNIIIYLEQDSIYHPGLSLDYNNAKRQLFIYREEKGLSKAPFYDSYHQLDLYVEAMFWKLDEDFIDMKSVVQSGSVSEARFESLNLFTRARYDRMQGIDRINPVKAVYNFTRQTGYNDFYAEDFGRYIGMGKTVTINLLMDLASKGFLIYDIQENYVIVKDRVRLYIEASEGKVDYDVIGFKSSTVGIPNASLNLLNNELIIQGVRMVFLSDSQQVFIYPAHKQVTVMKNRDFKFDGIIRAGKFDLAARECYFSYEKFELDLPVIDSLSFRVTSFDPNEFGEHYQVRVKSLLRDLKGNILIDKPDNKSGRKMFAEYPIMNSKSYSYVYYDQKSIFNGVYTKDKFYYRLDPFSIDSLDNFETDKIQFEGSLTSAGIFKDIEQPLKVQPDYSLGFVYHTGSAGRGLYGDKGKFIAEISLSNQGLRGNGAINYLTSTSYSDNFMFFPDSTNANLSSFEIEERKQEVQYPFVMADSAYMHWTPYQDQMNLSNLDLDQPMAMYSSEAHMNGTLNLRPSGLEGNGVIFIKEAEMVSGLYKFKYSEYFADTVDFRLKKFVDIDEEDLESENDYAYETNNFSTHVDFDERKADFEANGGEQKVDFPENMYICYMDKFTWYMDRDETEFSSKTKETEEFKNASLRDKIDLDLAGSQFVSTHPDQDSLTFYAQRAIFSRHNSLITANEVAFILVADAALFPDNGKVLIHKKADMEELSNARLVVNTTTKYHELYNGTFKILGRKKYYGRALYDYKDEDGNIQNIFFTEIEVDTTGTSLGHGRLEESAQFTLSKNFDFVGDVNLVANKEFLRFMGGTSITHNCDTNQRERLFFDAYIDPVDIRIPVPEQPLTPLRADLFAGMLVNSNGLKIYPAFLQKKRRSSDKLVFSANGYLIYDKSLQEYRISTEDRLNKTNKTDNYLSLSKRSCEVLSSGQLKLAFNTGWVEARAYGDMTYYSRKDSTSVHVAIPFDFFFNEKALEIMANDLNSRMELDAVNLQSENMRMMLGKLEGEDKAEKLMTEIATHGGAFRKVPESLQKTLVIADVEMKWNPRTKSFVSTGKIGISNMGKVQILKYVDGRIEIKNKGSNVKITIAFDLGGKEYYFFMYNSSNGLMAAYSSNKDFLTQIKETKPDDRKLKTSGKEKPYSYYISTATSYKAFMRKMKLYF
jgi:hypothetical protein